MRKANLSYLSFPNDRIEIERSRPPQILVVEDDDDLRAVVGDILREEGFSVVGVTNGRAALDYLFAAATSPRLILMDMNMPVMSGPEAIRVLRSHPRFSTIPVLVLTSSVQPEDCPKEGTVGRLEKPYSRQALLAIVRTHLGPSCADGASACPPASRRLSAAE